MSRSIIAVAAMSSPKISPQALNGLLRGDDHRGALVAVGDQAEHEVRGFGVERDVADLVDDEQRDERQASQLGLELALAFGFAEPGDPLGRGRELHALAGEAGADRRARSRGVSCRSRAGRAGSRSRLACRKSSWPRCSITVFFTRALEGEVELLQRLAGGEPGGLDPALAAVAVARGDLGAEQDLGEPLIAPGLLAGPVGEHRAAPWPRPAPSARGTGARARTRSWSCRDQRVIARRAAGSRPRPRGAGGAASRWRSSSV